MQALTPKKRQRAEQSTADQLVGENVVRVAPGPFRLDQFGCPSLFNRVKERLAVKTTQRLDEREVQPAGRRSRQ